ncbi:MAG TPA: TetR/AcrR family transcriptional regulator [Myxococcota bacterium]|nr:TetR/AcrR family transcriptional regulator [Myxococcota bacterium]
MKAVVSGASRRGAASREAILQAAVRVIGREGLAGASLAEVAKEANTSKPAVLYHFGSREHLLHEVASMALGLYRGLLAPAEERGPTPQARAEAAIAKIFVPENRTLLACVHELVGLGMRDAAIAELMRASLEAVQKGPVSALGNLGSEEARAIARSLIMTVHGHVELWLCSDPADSKEYIESATRAALALLPAAASD